MFGSSTTPVGKDIANYELTVVYTPEIVADTTDAVSDTVADAISAGFGVCSMDIEGNKSLPYAIRDKYGKEQEKGIYAYFNLTGAGTPSSLTNALDWDHRVLRYLLVRAKR